MEMQSVSSSQISEIGYDEETLEAQVRFTNGSLYSYSGVPAGVVEAIVNSESVGRAFNQTLKFGYQYRKLE